MARTTINNTRTFLQGSGSGADVEKDNGQNFQYESLVKNSEWSAQKKVETKV